MTQVRGDDAHLPAELRPRWVDLPALAWTAACAYGAGPRWLRRLPALVCAPLLWLPVLAGYRARGAVARRTRHAVLLVGARTRSQARATKAVTAAVLLASWASFAAAVFGCAALEPAITGDTALPLTRLLTYAVPVLLGAGMLPLLRALPRLTHLHNAQRSGAVEGWDQAWRGEVFAAWPLRRGHGTALLEDLDAAAPDVAVMALARDDGVAALYGRFGLQPLEPGSLIVTRDPSGPMRPGV